MNFTKRSLISVAAVAIAAISASGCTSALTTSEQKACSQYASALGKANADMKSGRSPGEALQKLSDSAQSASGKASTLLQGYLYTMEADISGVISAGQSGDKAAINQAFNTWERDSKKLADHCSARGINLTG